MERMKQQALMVKTLGFALFLGMVVTTPAFAGADVTFAALSLLVTNWLQGSLGTLLALIGALFGIGAALGGRWSGMVTGFGVAAGAFFIPAIIPSITTGTL